MKTIKNFIISSLTDDNGTLNKDIISIIFRHVIASLFFIMIAITFIQVIFRYILNSALPWAGEIAIFFFIWIIFLGATISLVKGLHIGVDIFTNLLNKKYQRFFLILTNILIILLVKTAKDRSKKSEQSEMLKKIPSETEHVVFESKWNNLPIVLNLKKSLAQHNSILKNYGIEESSYILKTTKNNY